MKDLLEKLDRAREILGATSSVCLTMDVDWASEYAVEQALAIFEKRDLPVTVFVTHKSKAIERALTEGRIKCGIHPNFMPGSSQGNTYQEVANFCFELLPGARLFRAHRYYDGNDPMEVLVHHGIKCESNICTLMDILPPFLHRSQTVSFPIFWEDGAYLYNYPGDVMEGYNAFWKRFDRPGLKVINIHPMHLMLNTPYFSYTREIKDRISREEWNHLDENRISRLRYNGEGITQFIEKMLDDIQRTQTRTAYLEDVYDWITRL